MLSFKSVLGVIGGLVAVLYCGGLFYYFMDVGGGSVQSADELGLGPTLLGLGIIGLVFCIVLIVKVARIFFAPGSSGSGGRGGSSAPTPDGDSDFDADAAIARHMARRSVEGASEPQAAPSPRASGAATSPPSFGRRIR